MYPMDKVGVPPGIGRPFLELSMKNAAAYRVCRLLLISGLAVFSAPPAEAARRPNVVVILTDDQGWGDLGLNGNSNLATPRIDALARAGASKDTRLRRAAPRKDTDTKLQRKAPRTIQSGGAAQRRVAPRTSSSFKCLNR